MTKLLVDIAHIAKYRLSMEAFMVLYCLYKNDSKTLVEYSNDCSQLQITLFEDLEKRGFIIIKDKDNITFSTLSLTDKGRLVFGDLDIDSMFEEFRKCYPISVKEGRKVRRLHGDLARCKKLYSSLLNEVSHEVLCKCARVYHSEMVKSNSEMYMQQLATWLHQSNYKQYLDSVDQPLDDGKGWGRDI